MSEGFNTDGVARPFDAGDISRRVIDNKSGREAPYIKAEVVIRRLTEIPYSFQIIKYWTEMQGQKKVALCHGKLTIDGIAMEDIGTAFIHEGGSEEQWKSAQSDCIKRCARMFGIGLQVWEGDPLEQTRGRPADQYDDYSAPVIPARQNNAPSGGYSNSRQNNYQAQQSYQRSSNLGPSERQVPFIKSLCHQKGLVVMGPDGQMHADMSQVETIAMVQTGKGLNQLTPKEISDNVIEELKALSDAGDDGVQL